MIIEPSWPAGDRIIAFTTTRLGGVSKGNFASLNLSFDVGDDPTDVEQNRKKILCNLPPSTKIKWLHQEHGGKVIAADQEGSIRADASWTSSPGWACAIQTADCLPVLFSDCNSSCVAAAHVGWRGLLCNILENLTREMPIDNSQLMAWFGPRIGPKYFEIREGVVDEIRTWILSKGGAPEEFLKAHLRSPGCYLADLSGMAALALSSVGISKIYRVDYCSYLKSNLFYSHRRDNGLTGRMATVISLKY